MANWYVSQTKWAALTQWSALASGVTVGTIWRPLTGNAQYFYMVFRCSAVTTGITGATEPTWPQADSSTVTDGGVTWTNVTGQSAYGWGAAAGDIGTLFGYTLPLRVNSDFAGSTVWIDSTQAETGLNNYTLIDAGSGNQPYSNAHINIISVNTGGSVPPASADYTVGASLSFANNFTTNSGVNFFGVNITVGSGGIWNIADGGYLDTTVQDSTMTIPLGYVYVNGASCARVIFRNPKFVCSTGQTTALRTQSSTWAKIEIYTTNSIFNGGIVPTNLMGIGYGGDLYIFGSGLGMFTGSNYLLSNALPARSFVTLEECTVNVNNIFNASAITQNSPASIIKYINCDTTANNTNYNSGIVSSQGNMTTSISVYRNGGASVEGAALSWELVGQYPTPQPGETYLETFNLAVDNQLITGTHTATVEVIGTGTAIQNTDLTLEVFYQSSTSNSSGSRAVSQPNVIATAAALASSTQVWTGSPGGSAQKLTVTFTPRKTGPIMARVRLHSAITVYVDPVVTIT